MTAIGRLRRFIFVKRTAGFGALLPVAPGAMFGRSCPEADTHYHPHERRGRVGKGRSAFARRVSAMPWKPSLLPESRDTRDRAYLGNTRVGLRAEIFSFTGS